MVLWVEGWEEVGEVSGKLKSDRMPRQRRGNYAWRHYCGLLSLEFISAKEQCICEVLHSR
jgi:hypothetical protein